MSDRASLSLSANAIVILVLAMVLLGLGVGFITNIFKDQQVGIDIVTEIIQEQLVKQLTEGDKKLALTTTSIDMGNNAEVEFAIGVKNREPDNLEFNIKVYIEESGTLVPLASKDGSHSSGLEFVYSEGSKTLGAEEEGFYNIIVKSGTVDDDNILVVKVEKSGGGSYAEQDFFVKVR